MSLKFSFLFWMLKSNSWH